MSRSVVDRMRADLRSDQAILEVEAGWPGPRSRMLTNPGAMGHTTRYRILHYVIFSPDQAGDLLSPSTFESSLVLSIPSRRRPTMTKLDYSVLIEPEDALSNLTAAIEEARALGRAIPPPSIRMAAAE